MPRFPLPSTPPDEVRIWRLQMPTAEMGFFHAFMQAHEGMGITHTLDNKDGIVEVWVMPPFREGFERLIDHLRDECRLTVLEKERPYRGEPRPKKA